MALDAHAVQQHLSQFNFASLFTQELGWDFPGSAVTVAVDGQSFVLNPVADKRGVRILLFTAAAGAPLPDSATRRKIERQVTQAVYEHLIIFVDGPKTTQIWQWADREPGRPARLREIRFCPAEQSGALLQEKLLAIRFTLSEEESIDLALVTYRLKDSVP